VNWILRFLHLRGSEFSSERLVLQSLEVPERIRVLQASLHERYLSARVFGSDVRDPSCEGALLSES